MSESDEVPEAGILDSLFGKGQNVGFKIESRSDLPFRRSLGTRPTQPWTCARCPDQVTLCEDGKLVSYMGFLLRKGMLNNKRSVQIGGMGYGMTVEEREGEGHFKKVVQYLVDHLREEHAVDLVLLTCLDALVPMYKDFGFQRIDNVWIEQPGVGRTTPPGEIHFMVQVFNDYLLPIRTLDLKGKPW